MGRKRKKQPRHFRQMKSDEREKIEELIEAGRSAKEISDIMHVSLSTVYRELRRGKAIKNNLDHTQTLSYSKDKAQHDYEAKQKNKGTKTKKENSQAFIERMEYYMLEEGLSPVEARKKTLENPEFEGFSCCVGTVYNWLKKGVFPHVVYEDLPVKKKSRHLEDKESSNLEQKSYNKGMEEGIIGSVELLRENGIDDITIIKNIMKKYCLTQEKAEKYIFVSANS